MVHYKLRAFSGCSVDSLHRRDRAKDEELPGSGWHIPLQYSVGLQARAEIDGCAFLQLAWLDDGLPWSTWRVEIKLSIFAAHGHDSNNFGPLLHALCPSIRQSFQDVSAVGRIAVSDGWNLQLFTERRGPNDREMC